MYMCYISYLIVIFYVSGKCYILVVVVTLMRYISYNLCYTGYKLCYISYAFVIHKFNICEILCFIYVSYISFNYDSNVTH